MTCARDVVTGMGDDDVIITLRLNDISSYFSGTVSQMTKNPKLQAWFTYMSQQIQGMSDALSILTISVGLC